MISRLYYALSTTDYRLNQNSFMPLTKIITGLFLLYLLYKSLKRDSSIELLNLNVMLQRDQIKNSLQSVINRVNSLKSEEIVYHKDHEKFKSFFNHSLLMFEDDKGDSHRFVDYLLKNLLRLDESYSVLCHDNGEFEIEHKEDYTLQFKRLPKSIWEKIGDWILRSKVTTFLRIAPPVTISKSLKGRIESSNEQITIFFQKDNIGINSRIYKSDLKSISIFSEPDQEGRYLLVDIQSTFLAQLLKPKRMNHQDFVDVLARNISN